MQEAEKQMQKAIEALKGNFTGVRTGRANPALIEKINVEYYGSSMQLKQISNISVPDARQLLITPFDKGSITSIEKAIQLSDLGITPNNMGDSIRINLPPLTEERRKDLIKIIKNYAEESKISIRNARHAFLDRVKKQEKDKEISADEAKGESEKIQKIVEKYTKDIDELFKHKEKEIMED